MKKHLLAALCLSVFAGAEAAVQKDVNESPAIHLAFSILDAIPNDHAMATDEVKLWKFCLGLAREGAMTENCKAMENLHMEFAKVACRHSGHFLGPVGCSITKVEGEEIEFRGASAHALLAAFTAAGAMTEGAAGQRFMITEKVALDFTLSQFEGGAGAKVSFETMEEKQN